MGLFARALIKSDGSLPRQMRSGDGFVSNPRIATVSDAAQTLTVAQLSGGAIMTTLTAGRVFTTPTAAQMIAAAPDMDIGDSFELLVSSLAAFAITWAAGAGVTLAGRATTPASANSTIIVTRTGAATMTWTVL